jgi:HlyD family secretion protein
MHGTKLVTGMGARVSIGDTLLDGQVSRILPEVENGTITLLVDLVQRAHPSLRANRRVDVHLVTARSEGTLRVARGHVVHTDEGQVLFVIHGEAAIRTPVKLGIASFEHQEILEGLSEGDKVVLSDMSDYANVREVKLR